MKPTNVLWISTHDINPDLGAYAGVWPGAEYASTPNLDRLAAQGARYDNAFAAASICAPARSAIMTGCFPSAIGTMHMRTKAVPPAEVRLLPEYFREAGYYCTNSSFTDFQVDTPRTAFDDCSDTGHWRNRPNTDTPFFSAFHGMITHESQIYLEDDEFAAATSHVTGAARHDPDLAPLPPYYPDTAVFRKAWARYADLVTEMDHWVGGILDELEEDGLADSTVVVFWSDHGRGMPRGKRWINESGLREPLIIRWPGVIEPGTVRKEIVHMMDLAPTMLAMSGLSVPKHMHGAPLIDSTGKFAEDPNEFVFAGRDRMDELEDMSRTVRDNRFRYIRHFHPDRSPMQHCQYPDQLATWAELRRLAFDEANQLGRGEERTLLSPLQRGLLTPTKPEEELYDLSADPHETRNLANDPGYTDVVLRMRDALSHWQERYGDLGLLPEDELIRRWRPHGHSQVTLAPSVHVQEGRLVAECSTEGSSIGWTTDEPRIPPSPRSDLERVIGSPENDGRHWNLYSKPVPLPTEGTVWFKAWRLGFEPSEEIVARIAAPASAGTRS